MDSAILDKIVLLTGTLTFLGFVCGYFIGRYTEEEVNTGKKLLQMTAGIIFLFTLSSIFALHKKVLQGPIIAIIVIILCFIYYMIKADSVFYYSYPVMAIMLALSTYSQAFFLFELTLIFMYGLIIGSINSANKKDDGIGYLIGTSSAIYFAFMIVYFLGVYFI